MDLIELSQSGAVGGRCVPSRFPDAKDYYRGVYLIGECVLVMNYGAAKIERICIDRDPKKCQYEEDREGHCYAYMIKYPDSEKTAHIFENQIGKIIGAELLEDTETCKDKPVEKLGCDPKTTCCNTKCCVCDRAPDQQPKAPVVWSCSGECSGCEQHYGRKIQEKNKYEVQTNGYKSGQMTYKEMKELAIKGIFRPHDACIHEHPER